MSVATIQAALAAQVAAITGPPYTTNDIQLNVATALYAALQIGDTAGAAALTGEIGETLFIGRLFTASIPLTTLVAAAVGTTPSITLTPGDYDVRGSVTFSFTPTTNVTRLDAFVSPNAPPLIPGADAYVPNGLADGAFRQALSFSSVVPVNPISISLIPYKVLVPAATTLTLYLGARASFTASGCSAGGHMEIRRVR